MPSEEPINTSYNDIFNGESAAVQLHAHTKRVYANAHTYHINSLAMNSDGQTFISADDLRINWWNLDVNDTSFSKSNTKFY